MFFFPYKVHKMGCEGVSGILNLKLKKLSPKPNPFYHWISTKKFHITKTGDFPEIYFCSCNHFLHRDLSAQLCFFKKWYRQDRRGDESIDKVEFQPVPLGRIGIKGNVLRGNDLKIRLVVLIRLLLPDFCEIYFIKNHFCGHKTI